MDPPFAWNCQVVAGAGVVEDVQQLYTDMHSYLAGLHPIWSCASYQLYHICPAGPCKVTEEAAQSMQKCTGGWLTM